MLGLLVKLLKIMLLPGLAQGPCDIEYFEAKPFALCRVRFSEHRMNLVQREASRSRYPTLVRVQKDFPDAVYLGNAGMFHANGDPVGLLVEQGQELAPMNLSSGQGNFFMKPNGVFWVDGRGYHVDASQEYQRVRPRARLATQSGPLLLDRGVKHPAFRLGSKHQKIRNAVGVSLDGQTAFFVVSMLPVNFWQLASFFQDKLGVQDALYLDGVVSSILAPGFAYQGTRRLGPIFVVRAR